MNSIVGKIRRRNLSSFPHSIRPRQDELDTKSLSLRNLQIATRALHRDGLVILEDVLNHKMLDALNEKMVVDARTLQSAGDHMPFNYNKGSVSLYKIRLSFRLTESSSNIQQDPPLTKEHFSPHIFLNPFARQILSSVMGPRVRLSFISGNTAMPPTPQSPPQSQPVHADADFNHPSCPFAYVANIPLVDMTVENGSTEVWLGTHIDAGVWQQEGDYGERASGRIRQDLLEKRRVVRPPSQPVIKKGSIIVRDLRLWHAGKPNFGNEVRVMLAMVHYAQWFR